MGWYNFLDYMFEVLSIIYRTLKSWRKDDNNRDNLIKSLLIGLNCSWYKERIGL